MNAPAIPLRTALTASLAEANATAAIQDLERARAELVAKARDLERRCDAARQAVLEMIVECRRYQEAGMGR